MDRFDRIYRLHHVLDGRRTAVPLSRLCEELNCHERTVYRTINDLRDYLGAPVDSVRDQGYVYDRDGERPYELPGLWFSADELQALLILYRHLEQLEPGLLREQLEPLRRRLDSLLADRRAGMTGLAERVRFVSIGQRNDTPAHFSRVAQALLQRQPLAITYRARTTEESTHRIVDPQRLVHYRDAWYLDAWCRLRADLRTFSIDRIQRLKALDESAEEIDGERLDAHYASAYGIFAGAPEHVAVLRFSERGARWAAAVEWHPHQDKHWRNDGGCDLWIPFSDDVELVRDIMAYGPEVEVLAPESLRQRVERCLEKTLAVYEAGRGR